jgi:Rrf2 family iron-responsive transcriptional regulator
VYVTHQTNYSLRILMYCAISTEHPNKVPVIAAKYQISETHLFKILPILYKANFVEPVRGRNGGIRLAKRPQDIRVGDVFRVTEDRIALAECFEDKGTDCPLIDTCRLRSVWSEAFKAFIGVLDRYTIADLIQPDEALARRLGLAV